MAPTTEVTPAPAVSEPAAEAQPGAAATGTVPPVLVPASEPQTATDPLVAARALFDEAHEAYVAKEYEKALDLLTQADKLTPKIRRDTDKARAAIKRALAKQSDN